MKKITLLTLSLLGSLAFINAQNVITVDNSTGANADFSDLQSAISDPGTNNGDVIYVHPSETTYDAISLNKSLTLVGYSHSSSDKITRIADIVLLDGASDTKITGIFVVDDIISNNTTTLTNLVIENCYITDDILFNSPVDNVVIRGNYVYQIGNTGGNSSSNNYTNTLITNNVIRNYIGLKNFQSITIKNNLFQATGTGYQIYNAGSDEGTITVQNNIFYSNSSSSNDRNRVGVSFDNCLTYNLGSGSFVALNGTNNLDNQNPLFVEDNDDNEFDSDIDDYTLQAGSPAIGAGVNGEDLGLFDGSGFTFNNFGFTNGIPTINIQAISTTVAPGQNLNVIINTSNQ